MNRKNNITLNRIYNKRATRGKTNIKVPGWYKISKGGKCPDKDDYGKNITDNYWKHFGCDSYNNRETQEMRGKDAGQCAAERMADMKHIISENMDKYRKHIPPIKVAYDMGKNCLKNTLFYNSYTNQFKKYYKELIAVKPELHYIFQTKLGMGEYPLEVIAENIKEVETNNPIVYQNNKTKQTNTQKLNNKHKRTNKQNNKTTKFSSKITLV
jgi:hypothetical protein